MSEQQPKFEIRDEEQLSVDLIEAQYALKDSRGKKNAKSTLILMSGIELAGKGEAVRMVRSEIFKGKSRCTACADRYRSFLAVIFRVYSD